MPHLESDSCLLKQELERLPAVGLVALIEQNLEIFAKAGRVVIADSLGVAKSFQKRVTLCNATNRHERS